MENQKIIRISKQLNTILKKCSDAEMEICTAYYVPNQNEIEEYLKQGDYNTQLDNLLSGNNTLVKRMISSDKQQEFTDLINSSLTYEMGLETKFDKIGITTMIINLLSPVINSEDRNDFVELIEKRNIVRDIQIRVKNNTEQNLNIVSGINKLLQIKIEKTLGLNTSQYNRISGGINSLAQNIEQKLIQDGFIIRKIDLSSNTEALKNIKNNMLNDSTYLSKILPISKEKQLPKELLVQRIINSIMYKSASNAFKIEVDKLQGYIRVNGEILPITVYEEILKVLENNIGNAFRNINMYLTNSDTIFTDQFNRKYILHLDDTHILGIEKTVTFLKTLAAKKTYENNTAEYDRVCSKIGPDKDLDKLNQSERKFYLTCEEYKKKRTFCTNIEKKLETIKTINIPRVHPPSIKNGTKILFGPNLERVSSIFIVYNHLYKLSDAVPTTEEQITSQIEHISIIQRKVNEIMADQRDSKVFERLVYFLIKDSNNPIEVLRGISEEKLNDVFENNMCLFSNEYYLKMKENPSEFIEKLSILTEDKVIKIKNKYDEIFEIQNYLDYKYKVISQSIIQNVSYDKWEKYFSGKHDNEKGKLSIDRIGPFGIAQLLIENEVQEHKLALKNGTNITDSIFNLFKVDDKTYYIINFNFVTDINRIFIVNPKTGENEYHIICEMDAFDERLVAYFDEVNKNGVAHFYSVQNTEDVLISSFTESHIDKVIDFKGKEYSTMLVFAESSEDQRITQHYTSARGKVVSVTSFVKSLLNNKIELRRATALNVEGDYSQDSKKSISDLFQRVINHQRTLSKTEMNELSMIGCSNADYMIEKMTIEEVKRFIGIENITPTELELVKATLKLKNLQKLNESLIIRIREIADDLTRKFNSLLPGELDNGYTNTTVQAKEQQKNNELIELKKLLASTDKTIKLYEEVLLQKDSNDNKIPFETSQNIKEYFENNIYRFDINDIQILKYLLERSNELGDNELSKKINNYIIYAQLLKQEKTKFKKEYENIYSSYKYLTGTNPEQASVSAIVNNIQHTKPIETFDTEIILIKKEILNNLLKRIKMFIPDIGDDKYKYLELADIELSSIINVKGSQATKTIFKNTIELRQQEKRVSLERKVLAAKSSFNTAVRILIANDSMSDEEKIARIAFAAKDYIAKVKSYKEEYSFDGSNEISKYFFDIEALSKQVEYNNHKYDIFNSVFEENCSITEIANLILRKLEDNIMLIYHEYENTGKVLHEFEIHGLDNALFYGTKQTEYRNRVSSKVTICVLAIHKLYNEMVRYNSAIDNNKKDAILDIIESKMSDIKKRIDKVTKNNAFIMGTTGLIRHIPKANESIVSEQEQIELQLMAIDGETVVMPKR